MPTTRDGLIIRGAHTNVRREPFSHTRSQDFLWRCTFPQKKLTTFFSFLVVVTFKPTLNVQTFKRQKQCGKNLAADRAPWQRGGGSHGTTGTMVNPALPTVQN